MKLENEEIIYFKTHEMVQVNGKNNNHFHAKAPTHHSAEFDIQYVPELNAIVIDQKNFKPSDNRPKSQRVVIPILNIAFIELGESPKTKKLKAAK